MERLRNQPAALQPDPKCEKRPTNKGRKLPAEPLSTDEVRRLLDACNRGTTGLRARALIVTLWRAGLRVGEALALRPKDVDLASGTVRVLHGKGDRDRTVALDREAAEILARWSDRRRELGITDARPLFCTVTAPRGGYLGDAWVRAVLRRLARKAGIEKRVHPHGLRHTFAQDLALEGKSLLVIQQALGHQRVSTTALYLHRVAPVALIEALRDRPAWSDSDQMHSRRASKGLKRETSGSLLEFLRSAAVSSRSSFDE